MNNNIYNIIYIVTFLLLISCGKNKIETFYESGELHKVYYEKNGKLHGKFKQYYKNGQLEATAFFKNGLCSGTNFWYSEEGNITKESSFLNGMLHGVTKYYNSNSIEKEAHFTNDTLVKIIEYHVSENKIKYIEKNSYVDSIKIGEFWHYNIEGIITEYGYAENYKILYTEEFNDKGEFLRTMRVTRMIIKESTTCVGENIQAYIKIFGPHDVLSDIEVLIIDNATKTGIKQFSNLKHDKGVINLDFSIDTPVTYFLYVTFYDNNREIFFHPESHLFYVVE
jgi:antitoxin component YwqK of YwqJK toxin-antitoxin module